MAIGALAAALLTACGGVGVAPDVERDSANSPLPTVAGLAETSGPSPEVTLGLDGNGAEPAGLPTQAATVLDAAVFEVPATVAAVDRSELPTNESTKSTTVSDATLPRLVNEVTRYTCTIDYRRWLLESEWVDARDLRDGLAEFRELRPDCVGEKFDPVFSNVAVCQHRNRVGGAVVSRSFTGPATVSSRGLSITKQAWPGMLIHFERLPTLDQGGCWYYFRENDAWFDAVVDDYGQEVDLNPDPTPVPAESFLECDVELRERLATMAGKADAAGVQAMIDRVATGYGVCNLGWGPVVSADPLYRVCPNVGTGRNAGGDIVIHWAAPPGDGSACWLYDVGDGSWESVSGDP